MAKKKVVTESNRLGIGALLGEEYGRLTKEHSEPSAFTLSNEINNFIDTSYEEGFHNKRELNQLVAGQIANQAYLRKDKKLLNLMYLMKTVPTGKDSTSYFNYGNTLDGQQLINKVSDKLDADQESEERAAMNHNKYVRDRKITEYSILLGKLREDRGLPEYQGEEGQKLWTLKRDRILESGNRDGLLKWVQGEKKWISDKQKIAIEARLIRPNTTEADKLLELALEWNYPLYQLELYARNTFEGAEIDPKLFATLGRIKKEFVPIKSVPLYDKVEKNIAATLELSIRKRLKLGLTDTLREKLGESHLADQVPHDFFPTLNTYQINVLTKIDRLYKKIVAGAVGANQSPNPEQWDTTWNDKLTNLLKAVGTEPLDASDPMTPEIQEIREILTEGEEKLSELTDSILTPEEPKEGENTGSEKKTFTVDTAEPDGTVSKKEVSLENSIEVQEEKLRKAKEAMLDIVFDGWGDNRGTSRSMSVSNIITQYKRVLEGFPEEAYLTVGGSNKMGAQFFDRYPGIINVESGGKLDATKWDERNFIVRHLEKTFPFFKAGKPLNGDHAKKVTNELISIRSDLLLLLEAEAHLTKRKKEDSK